MILEASTSDLQAMVARLRTERCQAGKQISTLQEEKAGLRAMVERLTAEVRVTVRGAGRGRGWG